MAQPAKKGSIEKYFPKAINEAKFHRWTALGQSFIENSNFMEKLETALTDFKNFEYIYGESINKQQAFIDAVDGLKKLNNPSLVGQFIEYFMAADRLTQQYIFDAILL